MYNFLKNLLSHQSILEGDVIITVKFYGIEINWEQSKVTRISREPSPLQIMIDEKLENVEYLNDLGTMIKNNARCIHNIKSKIIIAKAAFNSKKAFFTTNLDFNFGKKLLKCHIYSAAFHSDTLEGR